MLFGSWTNERPEFAPGGMPPVMAYFKLSIMVVLFDGWNEANERKHESGGKKKHNGGKKKVHSTHSRNLLSATIGSDNNGNGKKEF
jgi:hypothetical protein